MNRSIKPESLIFLITLASSGVLMIVIGTLFSLGGKPFPANLFGTLGAAILGASASLLMARYFEPSQMNQLLQMIAESHENSLTRDDRQVQPFRLKFHGYLRSHGTSGEPVWRYRIFDFTRAHTPGHLHAIVSVPQADGSAKLFAYDGFVCGQHLLLVGRATVGAEPFVVHVFPNGCTLEGSLITGLAFVRSFDTAQLVAPTVLSTVALTNQSTPGEVNEKAARELTELWEAQFLKHNSINFATSVSAKMPERADSRRG